MVETNQTPDPQVSAVEIEPGIYAIRQDGDFNTDALRALVNPGSRDCTAYIYAREFVSRCTCLKHVDNPQIRDHQAGELFSQQTVYAGVPTMLTNGFVPADVPLTVRIAGYVPGGVPASVQIPPSSPAELARREAERQQARDVLYLDRAPRPIRDLPLPQPDSVDRVEAEQAALRAAHAAGVKYGRDAALDQPGAALFPGFIVSCERCRSANVSLDTRPNGKSYLECEDCGNMGRVRLE